MKVHGMF